MSRKTNKNRAGNQPTGTSKKDSQVDQGKVVKQAIDWFLHEIDFSSIPVHKNTGWDFSSLVILSITTAWVNGPGLVQAFNKAKESVLGCHKKLAIQTYQGMSRAISTHRSQLFLILWERIQFLLACVAGSKFRIYGFVPIAVDGSRFTTSRTISNELAFSKQKKRSRNTRKSESKKGKTAKAAKRVCDPGPPQIWVTLFWHLTLQISWRWSQGPSYADERQHFKDTLATSKFPKKTLFIADAGFVGYELWSLILDQGYDFVVRVGANVKLIRQLHHKFGEGIVCLWPKDACKRGLQPIVLRLVKVQSERGVVYIVTSVTNSKVLSDNQIARLYSWRWGIEVQFRSFKQTYGRRKLRSRNAEHAKSELDTALLSLTVVQLFALRERIDLGEAPADTSVARAICAIREAIEKWREKVEPRKSLTAMLAAAKKDRYQSDRSKEARYRPVHAERPSASKPVILKATNSQRRLYQQFLQAA